MKSKYSFEMIEIEDQVMAVPTEESDLHGVLRLNDTAAAILKLLQEETTEEEIVQALLKDYSGSQEEIAKFVHSFCRKLMDNGIIA